MNPETHYDKQNIINETTLNACLEQAQDFNDFITLLEDAECYIYHDTASDLWTEYLSTVNPQH